MTPEELLPGGPLGRIGRVLRVFAELDSTNTFLLQRAESLPDGSVAVAEYQSAGRGRQGRAWLAPRGSSILLSVLLIEAADSALSVGRRGGQERVGAPLAAMLAALAGCEAIEASSDCRPVLRWPNDLMLSGKKVGGVLAETTPLAPKAGVQARRAVVIGVGINCLQQPGHFPPELAGRATSLEIESARAIDRSRLGRELLRRLDGHLVSVARSARGAEQIREGWKSRCADFGARARLQCDGQSFSGTVLDMTAEGDLLVQLAAGGRRYFGSATTTRLG